VASAPDNAVEETSVNDAASDEGADGDATADGAGAVDADDLVATTVVDTAASGIDDGEATTNAADTTPVPNGGDGGDRSGDPTGGNGDGTAVQTSVETADDDAAHGSGSAPQTGHDTTSGADDAAASAATPTGGDTAAGKVRRPSGSLDKAILAILQARPDMVFKVGELCRLINKAEEGTGTSPASPGAVVLAGQRLVARQLAMLAVEKPASFQLLPGTAEHTAAAAQPYIAGSQTGTGSATQAGFRAGPPDGAVDAVTVG
jgi:hypothetical protein